MRLEADDFRHRIDELDMYERSKKLIADFLLDGLRTKDYFSAAVRSKVKDSISFLRGYDASMECEDAQDQIEDWGKIKELLNNFQKPISRSEHKEIESKLKKLCSNLKNPIAVLKIVDTITDVVINLHNTQTYGGGVFIQSIDLRSGNRETREYPTAEDAQNLGVAMLASMDKALLRYCKNNNDYTLNPGCDRHNYNLLLKKALNN